MLKRLRRIVAVLGILLGVGLLAREFFFTFLYAGTRTDWEVSEIGQEMSVARQRLWDTKLADASEDELRIARQEFAASETALRERLFRLAKENPGSRAGISSLYLVAGNWPDTEEGEHALRMLLQALEKADLDHVGETFETLSVAHIESLHPLVPVLLRREKENPDHPYAAKLLTQACIICAPKNNVAVAPEDFREVADTLVERHAVSPKLANFCEVLGRGGTSPSWAQPFEPHLRRILEVNQDRFVRCSAKIALASLVQESGEERQSEALKLYEEFLSEFDGKVEYAASGIEEKNRDYAKRSLKVIHSHGLGMEAPATSGVDLDGNPMSLAEYRGQVVLVSFWGTWCAPCLRMVPHEKDLIERFGDEKFAIVGVNADKDIEKALKIEEELKIPWRSFRNERDGQNDVSNQWLVSAYPTFYLLDSKGVIRKRWIGEPTLSEVNDFIERLLQS